MFVAAPDGARAAGTFYVDGASTACSDLGPGSEANPYCTISAAVTARGGPGTTILVKPGIYREQVTVGASGDSLNPLTIRALGSPVVVDGADDFSSTWQWQFLAGGIWLATGVDWTPNQVFSNGARLSASVAPPESIALGTFRYVAGRGLYVNVGGVNPGSHPLLVGQRILVGHRVNGFQIAGRSGITIDGLTVTHAQDRGIFVTQARNLTIIHCTINWCARSGIQAVSSARLRVAFNGVSDNGDHGIALSGVVGSTLEGNESMRNARPEFQTGSGIYLSGSTGNLIRNNRLHHNLSTGLYLQSASNDNLSVQNLAYENGGKGFSHVSSTGTRHVGDVAWKNKYDGIAVQAGSTGTTLFDCIASDNALTVAGHELVVDAASALGFASDYNLFFNSAGAAPVRYSGVPYATVAAYISATGRDVHSLQSDPRFVSPGTGNFHPASGSPAIDSGNSSVPGWPAKDAEGSVRVDVPATPNTGTGPVPYADRGAIEFAPKPPVAALTMSPAVGNAPLAVTVNASASVDPDGAIVSYRFQFGDGAVAGPQASPTAVHTYAAGTWTARVTVTDRDGLTGAAQATVTAMRRTQPPNGTIDSPPADVTIAAGQSVVLASTGSDADGPLPLTFSWDLGAGRPKLTAEDPGEVVFATSGVYRVILTVSDAAGTSDPTPDTLIVTVTTPVPGIVADGIHWTILGPSSVAFDWRGSASTVRYGTTSAYGRVATARPPVPYPFSSGGPYWEAVIAGLEANTVYHYSIGNGPDHTFRTAPPRGPADFTIFVEGDIGDSRTYPRVGVVQSQIASGQPSFVLAVGDLTYADDHGMAAADRHFNDAMVWSQDAAYMPAWGNHDWEAPDDLRNYKGRFALPNPQSSPGSPAIGGASEDWYWFDYGHVRFIGYPEPWSGAWSDWNAKAVSLMDQAQADPAIGFIVTFGHRPAYSSGHHQGDPELKGYLDGLWSTHRKYVLNLNGHSHSYERTFPQSGVVHVTVGGGGSSLEDDPDSTGCVWEGGCPPPAWSAFRAMHHGALRLHFGATGIQGYAICGPPAPENDFTCDPGSVMDAFSIGMPLDRRPEVMAPVAVSGAEGSPITVTVRATDPDGEPITSLTADLSALPPGADAAFAAGPDYATGTLSWTPACGQAGGPYTVRFTASNLLWGSARTAITVAAGRPPVAALTVRPQVGLAPLAITADASASSDSEGLPLSYRFDFGDGTVVGPQASPTAVHSYGPGEWVATVRVTDSSGCADTSAAPVSAYRNLVTNPSFETSTAGWNAWLGSTLTRVAGGLDGASSLEVRGGATTAMFGVNDAPNWVSPAAGVGTRYRYTAWVRSTAATGSARLQVREFLSGVQQGVTARSPVVTLSPAWQRVAADYVVTTPGTTLDFQVFDVPTSPGEAFQVDKVAIRTVTGTDPPPRAELKLDPPSGVAPLRVSADASASTDAGGAPLAFAFDFGDGTVIPAQSSPVVEHVFAPGVWRVTLVVIGDGGARDTALGLVSSLQNLVTNPSFEASTSGWSAYSGSAIGRIAGGRSGDWSLDVRGPVALATFGVNDSPNWVGSVPAAGTHFRCTAWVRSASSRGAARLQIREWLGTTQMGVTTRSPAVALSADWQAVTADYVSAAAGSKLDLQVLDSPVAAGETFLADDISIVVVPDGAAMTVPEFSAGVSVSSIGAEAPDSGRADAPDRPLGPFRARLRPNPLTVSGTLEFATLRAGRVCAQAFDARGRRVRTWVDGVLPAGRHALAMEARDQQGDRLPAGVYFYRVQAPDGVASGRFLILE